MKTTKLVAALGVATFATAILGTTVVQAEKKVNTEGKVEFVDNGDSGIVPPPGTEEPDPGTGEPVNPPGPGVVPPVEENGAKLVYYPNFNFGIHNVTTVAQKYHAILTKDDQWTYGEDGKTYLAPFIQVQNTPEVSGWNVDVKLGNFLKGTDKLLGAKIVLSNLQVDAFTGHKAELGTGVSDEQIELVAGATNATNILTYTKGTATVMSVNSLAFGDSASLLDPKKPENAAKLEGYEPSLKLETNADGKHDEDKDLLYATGVSLELNAGSNMQVGEYKADLEWTLTATK